MTSSIRLAKYPTEKFAKGDILNYYGFFDSVLESKLRHARVIGNNSTIWQTNYVPKPVTDEKKTSTVVSTKKRKRCFMALKDTTIGSYCSLPMHHPDREKYGCSGQFGVPGYDHLLAESFDL